MKAELLSSLRCPAETDAASPCSASLGLVDTPAAVYREAGREIHEGVLKCAGCGTCYPIIAGVAMLLPRVRTWLRSNYYYVLSGACESGGLGADMMDWLRTWQWHLGNRYASNYYEEHRWVHMFVEAHYDSAYAELKSQPALTEYLAQPRVYDLCAELLARHAPGRHGRALDVGTNVGGMAHRLAAVADQVIGVDLAFNPILTARRVQLGWPSPMRSYTRSLDGLLQETRALPTGQGNTDFLLGSAYALPLAGQFDVISALGVVDAAPAPQQILAQLASRLAPRGWLVVSSPYSWTSDDVPVEQWMGGHDGLPSDQRMLRTLESLGLEVIDSRDYVPWTMREHQRWARVFLNHCVLARKKDGA